MFEGPVAHPHESISEVEAALAFRKFLLRQRRQMNGKRGGLRARFSDVPDFEAEPERLADTEWAALSACDHWDMRNLNEVADTGNFDAVCDIINRGRATPAVGDPNGWADRLALYKAARQALGLA